MMSHFSNVQDFLAMGGYGAYVWSAYGVVIAVFILQIFQAWRDR